MRSYHFKIVGNQDKEDGNAIPYFRTTQGSFFNKGSRRYQEWKDYVRIAFFKCQTFDQETQNELATVSYLHKGPMIEIGDDEEAGVVMDIYWKNGAHADADNVFKGIADALFVNDKNVTFGQFRGISRAGKGGEVLVWIDIIKRK